MITIVRIFSHRKKHPFRIVGLVAGTAILASLVTFAPDSAFAATCTITGTAGNDLIEGTVGDDVICGSGGDDVINGNAGNDTLLGGLGNDTVNGADGADSIDGGDGNDAVDGGDGNDTVTGGVGLDTLTGGEGDDTLGGGDGNDTISGDAGSDVITGGIGIDTIHGGDGNNRIDAGDGDDIVDTGMGNDTVTAGDGNDTITGGDGDDTLSGGNGTDTINADAGTDTITGDAGNDRASGGEGNDNIAGGIGADRLVGDSGNDVVAGATGDDYLDGGPGNDTLDGGNDADSVLGGDGADILVGGIGLDTMDGGAGDDHLDGGGDGDSLLGGFGADAIVGGWGDDTLVGGPGNDGLDGSGGTDTCDGSTGVNAFANCETQTQDPSTDPNPTPNPGPGPESDPATWIDTDHDIMPDAVEIRFGSDPLRSDTDSDGLSDDQEFLALTNPGLPDTDHDGLSDLNDDEDSDGASNGAEFTAGTGPIVADSDSDGLKDGQEAIRGTNPLVGDTDGDKLSDSDEVSIGTNPLLADGDADGIVDGDESTNQTVAFPDTGASFDFEGTTQAALTVSLRSPENVEFHNVVGLRAPPVEVVADGPISGTLAIPFETDGLDPSARLGIVHFNEESGTFDSPPTQTVDLGTGIATVTTDHFSPFFLVDLDEFESSWYADLDPANGSHYDNLLMEFVLAFNTTDSLAASDPDGYLKPAVAKFIDEVPADARFSVIDFGGNIAQPMTTDRTAVKDAIRNLADDDAAKIPTCDEGQPETNGLWCLTRVAFASSGVERKRKVIIFDDGSVPVPDDFYNRVPIYGAEHSGIHVYGVAFGENRDDESWDWFQSYSYVWHHISVPDPADIESALDQLAGDFRAEDRRSDSDGDGIPDFVERNGIPTVYGSVVRTDGGHVDTDGDGLTDGQELGQLITDGTYGTGSYYKPFSNPNKKDSDGDGLWDGQEWDLETNALLKDSDGDSLTDLAEVENGFDPMLGDADGDTFWDNKELADGSDPFSYDFDALGQAHAGFSGLVFGDGWDSDWARALNVTANVASNGWYLVGQLGSGYLVLGDIRDMVYGVANGQWLDTGMAAVAFLPLLGDTAKTLQGATKFATKSSTAVAAAVPVLKLLPEDLAQAGRKALALMPNSRLTRDINVNVIPREANFDIDAGGWVGGIVRKIGGDSVQASKLQVQLDELVRLKAAGFDVKDVRVNQHQTNIGGDRVGINRPDLQYTLEGKRYYVEYDRPRCGAGNENSSRRGDAHAQRILNNDPTIDLAVQVILVIAGTKCG